VSSLVGRTAPIAVAVRSGFDESVHHGLAVAVDRGGRTTSCVGDPDAEIYPRSSLKPLQATAMVELGLELPPEPLALACASHDGAAPHLDAVRRILERFGLHEADLQNTPSRPLDAAARNAARAAGVAPSPLQQNCSGKHAAMLATCRINGWPVASYLDPQHPLQEAITASIVRMAGSVGHVGVDGCGAPTHVLPLRALVLALAGVARDELPAVQAMRAHPELVGGDRRDVTIAMRAVPGLVMKDGAEGVMVAAMPDGRAVGVKVAGGSASGRQALTVRALSEIGIELPYETAVELTVPVLGHGEPVGEVRALEWTPCAS
jgi:L-asparaginase II